MGNKHARFSSALEPIQIRDTNKVPVTTKPKNIRYVFRDEISNQRRNAQEPAFITQDKTQHFVVKATEEDYMEPAILEGSLVPSFFHHSTKCCPETSQDWMKLFMARQRDLKLAKNIELQYNRFSAMISEQLPEKRVFREQGLGEQSALVLG